MPPSKEKRRAPRHQVKVPVQVRLPGSEAQVVPAVTRDISEAGMYLYSDMTLTEGSQLDLVLILPKEIIGTENQWVCCSARVVRVEEGNGAENGIAAVVEKLAVLPELK